MYLSIFAHFVVMTNIYLVSRGLSSPDQHRADRYLSTFAHFVVMTHIYIYLVSRKFEKGAWYACDIALHYCNAARSTVGLPS